MNGTLADLRPVGSSVDGGLHFVACVFFVKGVNGIFMPLTNLTLIGLFSFFWVYISKKNVITLFSNELTRFNPFPQKIFHFKPPLFVKLKNYLDLGFTWIKTQVLEFFN